MKRGVLLITALLLAIYCIGFWGCTREVDGPDRINQPPIVQFVNIPVSGSQFSSDTTIYWYGTDVDGFIRYFRYAVIESTVVGGDPMGYIVGSKADIDWTVLEVSLDNPNSNSKVNMSADVKDPVRKYVSSYVFLQAIDNLGEESDIIYRMFRKNNHFPSTRINYYSLNSPFINAASSEGIIPGIQIRWSATDPVDYPRDAPPFEYRWRFYGPYDSLEMVNIIDNYQQAFFVDANGDYYLEGDTLARMISADTAINTTVTPPETTITPIYEYIPINTDELGVNNPYGTWDTLILGVYDEIDSTALPEDSLYRLSSLPLVDTSSYLVEKSDGWLYDVEMATIYNAFRKDPSPAETLSVTRQRYFFFTCQARDDSKVPDNAPDFRWVNVLEPKHERDILLLDFTFYKTAGALWAMNRPTHDLNDSMTLKNVYGGLANSWKPGCFDMDNIWPEDPLTRINYDDYLTTQDYFAPTSLKDKVSLGIPNVSIIDVFRHKVLILTKDDTGTEIGFDIAADPSSNQDYIVTFVVSGLSSGMSAWSLMRNPFYLAKDSPFLYYPDIPSPYQTFFGLDNYRYTGWVGFIMASFTNPAYYIRFEDFIGAEVIDNAYDLFDDPSVFNFAIDSALLKNRYNWNAAFYPWMDTLWALPEVGYLSKNSTAKPLYEFRSLYADNENGNGFEVNNGRVVAIAKKSQLYRTMHFSFNLLAIDSITAQAIFNESMNWLSVQPFLETGKMDRSAGTQVDVQKLRSLQQEIEDNRRRVDAANANILEY